MHSFEMNRFQASLLLVIGSSFLAGCGGSAQKGGSTAVVESAQGAAAATPLEHSLPGKLVFAGRLRSSRELLGVGMDSPAIRALWAEAVRNEPFLEYVDLDKPIDVIVAVDEQGFADLAKANGPRSSSIHVGVAVGLTQFNDAMFQGSPFKLQPDGSYADKQCVASAAVGPAPGRLVCGDGDDAKRLSPYMTQALPLKKWSEAPFFAEFHLAGFRPLVAGAVGQAREKLPELLKDVPPPMAGLAEQGVAMLDDMLTEASLWSDGMHSLTMSAYSGEAGAADVSFAFHMDNDRPFLAEALMRAQKRVTGPPKRFFDLPGDAKEGGFYHGLRTADVAHIQNPIVELWDGASRLALSMQVPMVKPMVEGGDLLVRSKCWQGENIVWAGGRLPGATKNADAKVQPANVIWNDYVGWVVMGAPKSAQCGELVSDSIDWALRMKSLPKLKQLSSEMDGITFSPIKSPLGQQLRGYRLSVKKELLNEATSDERFAAAEGPLEISLLIMDRGDTTWIGVSSDQKLLESKLSSLGTGATLKGSSDVARVVVSQALTAQFDSIDRLLALVEDLVPESRKPISQVPSGIRTAPFVTEVSVKPGGRGSGANAMTMSWQVRVPPPVMAGLRKIADWTESDYKRMKEVFAGSDAVKVLEKK